MDHQTKITRSHLRIVSMILTHAEQFRLAKHDLNGVPTERLSEIGNEIVDVMERRIANLERKTPPATAGASGSSGGQRTARRKGLAR